MNFWQKLERPFTVLAPMENVTDFPFREVVATLLPRPNVFFTEFTSSDGLNSEGREKTLEKLKYSENQRPIIAQIWGKNPEYMYKAAQTVQQLGFDGVDINMGCPDKSVVKGGCGAGHIKDPKLAGEIIAAVKDGAKQTPISVKTRIGFSKIITEEWIGFLLEQKLDALTIHGRTAKQMSTGAANWEEIAKGVRLRNEIEAKERSYRSQNSLQDDQPDTVIIGNGDVKSYEEVLMKHKTYNVDGVMIGRGVFSNPWVFENEKVDRDREDYIAIMKKHMYLFTDFYGPEKHFDIMKKFFKMYINNFYGASEIRVKLMECKTPEEVERILSLIPNA